MKKHRKTRSYRKRKGIRKGKPKSLSPRSLDTEKYLDRELSFVQFQSRVLEQVKDKNMPIMERLRFLHIFNSNIDEFFMKRIANSRLLELSDLGNLYTKNRMQMLRKKISKMLIESGSCFENEIIEGLKEKNIEIINWESTNEAEQEYLTNLFSKSIFPILTPLAVDSRPHPFPHISNLSVSLAVSLRNPDDRKRVIIL